ncbi:MAG: O-methyltransferase [Candidatus Dadabacteria bacterium]|nr:O-methyltransferase [Candidatus Dadabacteria bacterium]
MDEGAKITNPEIEDYILSLYPRVNEVFCEMEKRAEGSDVKIVGPLVGRFLSQICLLRRPQSIFEMGSGFGYSALWFSLFLDDGGVVTCTDWLEENAEAARGYFRRAGQIHKLRFVCGDALDVLANSDRKFDMIFNDIDKENYPRVIELAREKLNPGGMLVTDNVLWGGRVLSGGGSESTEGVLEFNRLLFSDPEFFSTVVPLRDGVALSVRI